MNNFMKQVRLVLILLFILILSGAYAEIYAKSRLKLFTNGSIYIDANRRVDNLLIKNDTVQGVNVDASKFRNIEIIDLKGAALYPGFNASHVHLAETGIFF
ncbi:MAG TPA: hypothetical protein PKW98_11390 [Candidatus Wallbacteria bacterium]|nr:MAG: isoaspartyl dipeptidase [bacterium ADurb.Bin243]HOD43144.1 hypothetical protein [Candidatus Wallbacteria bacterium]HPG58410.1 hypothetical protein [Candidatus Wallbacteria bacterium]